MLFLLLVVVGMTGELVYETNSKFWVDLLGAELVSVFVQAEKVRFFFRMVDGRIIRVKVPVGDGVLDKVVVGVGE